MNNPELKEALRQAHGAADEIFEEWYRRIYADPYEDTIRARAWILLEPVFESDLKLPTEFYFAGNSLNGIEPPKDLDLFPTTNSRTKTKIPKQYTKGHFFGNNKRYIKFQSSNAITVRVDGIVDGVVNGIIVQFCQNLQPSLKALVDSFDFAHVQCGVKVVNQEIVEVYYTSAQKEAIEQETTWYARGHIRPISSLRRLFKFYHRGYLKGEKHLDTQLAMILIDIMKRGVKDEHDLSIQLGGMYGDELKVPKEIQDELLKHLKKKEVE